MEGKFHFAIDRGGTFTDIWCLLPDGTTRQLKLLSEDPKNYSDAPREGIRRIMEQVPACYNCCMEFEQLAIVFYAVYILNASDKLLNGV